MSINAILACDANYGIGEGNDLPWPRHDEDMKWFRDNTLGHVVVMGRKTWESIGSKPLPKRTNVVISNTLVQEPTEHISSRSGDVGEILEDLRNEYFGMKIWVMGGADIYRQAIPFCKNIYLTRFNQSFKCDKFISSSMLSDYYMLAQKKTEDASYEIWSRS